MSKFAIMNVLIKGRKESVEQAISNFEPMSYELHSFEFKPNEDNLVGIKKIKVGLVFSDFYSYEKFMEKDEIPFSSIPDIKFIGMANAINGNYSDGTYVFYKDFGEISISECYQFTFVSPFKEEFDGQSKVINKVCHSFMDHTWHYKYLDYGCGEYDSYAFGEKTDIELIEKWKRDEKKKSIRNKI